MMEVNQRIMIANRRLTKSLMPWRIRLVRTLIWVENQSPYENSNTISQYHYAVSSTQILSICEIFDRIFNDKMRNIIIGETNRKAEHIYDAENDRNSKRPPRKWKNFSTEELNAYLAILITTGVTPIRKIWQNCGKKIRILSNLLAWGKNTSNISRFLRFDDFNTRIERV